MELQIKPFYLIDPMDSPGVKPIGSIPLEHYSANLCVLLNQNGFGFDQDSAIKLHAVLSLKLESLLTELTAAFPKRIVPGREITPKGTKHGTISLQDFRWLEDTGDGRDLSPYAIGATFTRISQEPFNPSSPKQCIERLSKAGWRPTEKTKRHTEIERNLKSKDIRARVEAKAKIAHFRLYGWKISETNLKTLPPDAPESAQKLVDWLITRSRYNSLTEWLGLCRYSQRLLNGIQLEGYRIHGNYNPIGAWTHRKSHNNPNTANIPAVKGRDGKPNYLGEEFRRLWRASPGNVLIGCDADGIQLRVLAHYMNDAKFTEALVNGDSKNGTDAHTLNQRALGAICIGREPAKTFIYAWLLGAGKAKVGEILDCSPGEAGAAIDRFVSYYPGLKQIKQMLIPRDAARGWFEGFDGRRVLCHSEHHMLAGYLQNGESVIMKTANRIWYEQLKALDIPFVYVNDVHDEWVTETSTEDLATLIGKIQAQSIVLAGEHLKLRCPLKGNYKVGKTWFDIH